ncbi:deferrochelatase/peroxidase EfeB, partial [Kitasatospora sp. NPDC058263]
MDAENQQQSGTPAGTDADATASGRGGVDRGPISRRAVIGWAGAGVAIGAAGVGSVAAATRQDDDTPAPAATPANIPFYGEHQSGIATPVQDRLHFAAFDVSATAT